MIKYKMFNHLSYTRINLFYCMMYQITKNKYLGIFCINTSLAVLLSFESLYVLDINATIYIKKQNKDLYLCKFHKNFFYLYDFMIHIVPLFYLWYCNILRHMIYRENPKSLTINYIISIISCILHLSWGYLISNGTFHLEHIYIPSFNYKLSNNVWIQLWIIVIFAHMIVPNTMFCYYLLNNNFSKNEIFPDHFY